MTQDALVKSALTHWAARFVANGVVLTDFEEVVASVGKYDDWCRAWSAKAAVHEALGHDALAGKKVLTAGEHLQRAGVYYHFGKFLFVHDIAQMKAAHMKAVECRKLALPHLTPPGERVAIPFEGKHLYGILRKPVGVTSFGLGAPGRAPTRLPPIMIMVCGLDSAKEETEAYEAPFLARGIAILVFDGPGQGEAEYDFPIRGNYETAVQAVCDFVETRTDVDTRRLGLWGVSLGGYYAPRAAAFEKRVKACIALSGPYNMGRNWDTIPDLTREAIRVRSHAKTQEDGRRNATTLSLEGVASKIECPMYIVAGKQDRVVPWQDAERLSKEVKGPVVFSLIEDGNHVANNRGYKWRLQTADWMAEQLAL